MTKAICVAFALFFLGSSCMYVGMLLSIRGRIRREVKTEIKQGIPEKDLVVFHFTEAEFSALHFLKKDHEFLHRGQMYDIVRKTKEPNGITLHCISDVQETRLFRLLDDWVVSYTQHDATAGAINKRFTYFWSLKYFPQSVSSLEGYARVVKEPANAFNDRWPMEHHFDIVTPPPEV